MVTRIALLLPSPAAETVSGKPSAAPMPQKSTAAAASHELSEKITSIRPNAAEKALTRSIQTRPMRSTT